MELNRLMEQACQTPPQQTAKLPTEWPLPAFPAYSLQSQLLASCLAGVHAQ